MMQLNVLSTKLFSIHTTQPQTRFSKLIP